MELVSYDRIKVDRCTHCKGLWFQTGELERLRKDTWMADYILDEGDAKVGKKFDRIRAIDCPECAADMRQEFDAKQPHIVYETCPNGHGSFLDAGEFTDLVKVTFWDRFKSAR
jgi:Zn-finger nucleic acid-binding protein